MTRPSLAVVALVALGLARMTFETLGLPTLAGLAAATSASPAPKVFSSVDGLETFSTRFAVAWTDAAGERRSLVLDPETNARIRGPYNRRNAYGAILAYGPVLAADPRTAPAFRAIARSAFCGDAPIARELGIAPAGDAHPRDVVVHLEPRHARPGTPTAFPIRCDR